MKKKFEEDISFIELLVIIYGYRKILVFCFVIYMLICSFFIYNEAKKAKQVEYSYVTYLKLGLLGKTEIGERVYVETPETVLEKLNYILLPQLRSGAIFYDVKNVDIVVTNPVNTNLIKFLSYSIDEADQNISKIHKYLTETIVADHKKILMGIDGYRYKKDLSGGLNLTTIEVIALRSLEPIPKFKSRSPYLLVFLTLVFFIFSMVILIISSEVYKALKRKINTETQFTR